MDKSMEMAFRFDCKLFQESVLLVYSAIETDMD